MAMIELGFYSEALGMCTKCSVILPMPLDPDAPVAPLPTLYLLHGFGGNHTTWQRMSGIERYALRYGCAVVMPDMMNSSVEDMVHGQKWLTYIADELPGTMRGFFPLSDRRERTFVLGASMGGYAALKLALRRPELYAAAGSLSSGFTSLRDYICAPDPRGITLETLTFGEGGVAPVDREITSRVFELAKAPVRPRLYLAVGDRDTVIAENVRHSADILRSLPKDPYALRFLTKPGSHSWSFWDSCISDFMEWCGLSATDRWC